jgi:hypothetical protein
VRATIDETGCLRVTAETALESYALGAWSSAYFKNEGGDGQSRLVVENVRVSPPQTTEQGPHLANCTKKPQADRMRAKWEAVGAAVEGADRDARGMLVARLENMQAQGDTWLTVQAVLALLNDCDMLAARERA